jgi:crossover junction endodeoxyribonuclease RuvC
VRVVGIDPGVTGGLAVLDGGQLVTVCGMPVFDGRCSGSILADLLRTMDPDEVVVEKTQPMPKNGSIASFSLGMNTGIIFGVVETLTYPLTKIRPVDWKRTNGLVGKDKKASRALAMELWPKYREQFRLAKDDGKAEAALIARAYLYSWIKEQHHAASTFSQQLDLDPAGVSPLGE